MAWKHVNQGLPPCDGRTVYVGINLNGFACCFNDMDHLGQCWFISPVKTRLQMSGLLWWMLLERPDGVTVTVPINRPATLEEAEHAARIGACLPNGVMFDAFGRERVRYVRVIHDGTTCVVSPGDVADLVDPERPEDYRTEDVYLSKEEFDALPEFNGF